jgi:hypothetical protein
MPVRVLVNLLNAAEDERRERRNSLSRQIKGLKRKIAVVAFPGWLE